jgi:N-acetylglutamate synthase-like GNAT family acetyltransferase
VGESWEKREIYSLIVTNHLLTSAGKRQLLFNAGQHAREVGINAFFLLELTPFL